MTLRRMPFQKPFPEKCTAPDDPERIRQTRLLQTHNCRAPGCSGSGCASSNRDRQPTVADVFRSASPESLATLLREHFSSVQLPVSSADSTGLSADLDLPASESCPHDRVTRLFQSVRCR